MRLLDQEPDEARALPCPKCGRPFENYAHYGPGNVAIDSCVSFDLIWLDFGEMRQIVDAPGRDRGSKYVPPLDDEYIRHGDTPRPEEDESSSPRRDVISLLADLLLRG